MILGCATRVFGRQVVLVANVRPSLLHPICLRVIVVRKAVWLSGALIVPVPRHVLSIIVIAGRTFTPTLWPHAPVAAVFLRMLRNASRTFELVPVPVAPSRLPVSLALSIRRPTAVYTFTDISQIMRRLYSGDLAECFRLHRVYTLLAIYYGLDLSKCFPH